MKRFREFLAEDKEYTAIVKDRNTKDAHKITATSSSLKQFKSDLRSNGYSVMNAAPSDTFGSPEWERKLYTDRENRKQRKSNRLHQRIVKNDFIRERVKPERDAYDAIYRKWFDLPSLSPEKTALSKDLNAAYEKLQQAEAAAAEEYERLKNENN